MSCDTWKRIQKKKKILSNLIHLIWQGTLSTHACKLKNFFFSNIIVESHEPNNHKTAQKVPAWVLYYK